MALGATIKYHLDKNNMTAQSLAESVGMKPSTMRSLINNDSNTINVKYIIPIAIALRLQITELIGGQINEQRSNKR